MEEEAEVEVESSGQSVLSADNQEEKSLDRSRASSAEQEVSVPALLAVIGRNNPEASQSQEEVEPHSVLKGNVDFLSMQTHTEKDYCTKWRQKTKSRPYNLFICRKLRSACCEED